MTENNKAPRRYWLGGKRAAEQDRFFREALDACGWQAGDADQWDTGWVTGMPNAAQFKKVSPQRKLNHFPGNNALTVKSRLHDSLLVMRERLEEQFGQGHEEVSRLDFFPQVYSMPRDYHALQQTALEHPETRWILKPTNASKGKGICVLRDVAKAPMAPNWMVQEYLEHPHTIRGHKYVLRLYALIASIDPLRIYLYRQGFAKLASAPYDINDLDNLYSQLTNPDINALNTEAEVPVEFIDLDRYREWLRAQGHDDERLFARIHDLVTLTLIAAVDDMHRRSAESGANPRGCYELLGIDCLIDDALKPWILECNLSPSLGTCAAPDSGGQVEEAIKRGLVNDMVSLVGLDEPPIATAARNTVECLRREAEEELSRAGDFRRLYPNAEPERYLPLFSLPRLADLQLASAISGHERPAPRLQRRYAAELLEEDRLALYAIHTGRYYRLNDSASLIWLLATEGVAPDAIAEQLADASSAIGDGPALEQEAIRREVWASLAEWCREGLLMQRGNASATSVPSPLCPAHAHPGPTPPANIQGVRLVCGEQQWALFTDSQPVLERLAALLSPLPTDVAEALPRLDILRDAPGYALAAAGEMVASRLTLAALGPALITFMARRAARVDRPIIDGGLLTHRDNASDAVLCLLPATDDAWALAQRLANSLGRSLSRGVQLDIRSFGLACPLGLPAQQAGDRLVASPDPLHGAIQVQAVIVPGHWATSPNAPCQQLSPLDALGALLPTCFTHDGRPMDASTVAGFVDWLSRITLLPLALDDEDAACRALAERLSAVNALPDRAVAP